MLNSRRGFYEGKMMISSILEVEEVVKKVNSEEE